LTAQDASFLYAESQNGPTHIASLMFFEGHLAFADLVRHIESRLHLLPRYRQRLVEVPFNLNHGTWEDDADFQIDNHLKRHVIPKGSTDDDLVEAAMEANQPVMDRARPLWEMHSFEGLSGNRTAILSRVHHSLVDGVSGIELLTTVLDLRADAPPPPPPAEEWTSQPVPNYLQRLMGAAFDGAQTQLGIFRRFAETLLNPQELTDRAKLLTQAGRTFAKMMRPLAPAPWASRLVSNRRALAWSSMPFGEIRAIRNTLGGTVNDVVLTILTEAAARYLKHHDYDATGRYFRIGCPVNVRKKEETGALGNRVSMMFPEVPAEPMDPTLRLKAVNEETESIKTSNAPQGLELLMEGAELMWPSLIAMASRVATTALDAAVTMSSLAPALPASPAFAMPGFGMSFLATNVPGMMVPQYLAGHQVLDMIGLVPLAANFGYSVAIGSYNQKLYFGMMSEPTSMPDVDLMKAYVDEVFVELKRAADVASSADRSQGERRAA